MSDPQGTNTPRARFRSEPLPSLRPFVVEYWAVARDQAARGRFTVTPDSFGELICCADELYAVGSGGRRLLPSCFFVGLLRQPLHIEIEGAVRSLAARLRPWSIGRFLALGADHFQQGWQDARGVFGPRLARALELVARCDWPALVQVFDQVLSEQVGRWQPDETGSDVVEPFLQGHPPPTTTIAGEKGTSSRQVERRVRRLTGTSPKQLAGLSRFQAARDAIWADPSIDLARLALEVGYSDQPHLTREFRRYSGLTPAAFAREAAAKKF